MAHAEHEQSGHESEALAASAGPGQVWALLRAGLVGPPGRAGLLAQVGEYDILQELGAGGMGVVLLGRHATTGELAAVKLLRPELADQPLARRHFAKEVQHLRRLTHPHLVPVCAHDDQEQPTWFAMPYYPGGSVAQLLRRAGRLTRRQILDLALASADALAHCHRHGVLHRDLKPANLLLDETGRAYVSDLGLGRTVFNDSLLDVRERRPIGTVAYMAPELVRGEAGDTRADIYAWGAVLYELLTGVAPIHAATLEQAFALILAGQITSIRQRCPSADAHLTAVAQRAMAREVGARYASMDEVVADLQRVAAGRAPLHLAQRRRYRRGLMLVGFIVACLILLSYPWLARQLERLPWLEGMMGTRQSTRQTAASAPPRVLLHDAFADPQLNSDIWLLGRDLPSGAAGLAEKCDASATVEDGQLVLRAAAEHVDGRTVRIVSWVDSVLELAKLTDDLHLVVRFEHEIQGGRVCVGLARGDQQHLEANEHALEQRFWIVDRDTVDPRMTQARALTIDVYPRAKLAWLALDEGNGWLVNLADAASWRLRLLVDAMSSTGYEHASAVLRVDEVTVQAQTPGARLLGHVRHAITNRPLPVSARLLSDAGQTVTTAQGDFRLELPPGTHEVQALAPGYQQVGPNLLTPLTPGHSLVRTFMLRPMQTNYGDPVDAVVWTEGLLYCLTTHQEQFFGVLYDATTKQHWLTSFAHEGPPLRRLGQVDGYSGLAWNDRGELWATAVWPGRLLRLDPRTGLSVEVRQLPASWPWQLNWDGTSFWFLNDDTAHRDFAVHRLDPASGQITLTLTSPHRLRGLAVERGGRRLWVADDLGQVQEAQLAANPESGPLEAGVARRFRGIYDALTFADGVLWGLDNQAQRIARIPVGTTTPAPR